MISWNEQFNSFDVWYFWTYTYDVNRLKDMIGQEIWGDDMDSEPEVNKNSFVRRKTTIFENQLLKHSSELLILILIY